jgi:hypothetical protein
MSRVLTVGQALDKVRAILGTQAAREKQALAELRASDRGRIVQCVAKLGPKDRESLIELLKHTDEAKNQTELLEELK